MEQEQGGRIPAALFYRLFVLLFVKICLKEADQETDQQDHHAKAEGAQERAQRWAIVPVIVAAEGGAGDGDRKTDHSKECTEDHLFIHTLSSHPDWLVNP